MYLALDNTCIMGQYKFHYKGDNSLQQGQSCNNHRICNNKFGSEKQVDILELKMESANMLVYCFININCIHFGIWNRQLKWQGHKLSNKDRNSLRSNVAKSRNRQHIFLSNSSILNDPSHNLPNCNVRR